MKRIFSLLTLIISFLASSSIYAQNKTGTINGVIVDRTTKAPIEAASVTLYKDSAIVTGAETDASGKFSLTNLQLGKYKLEANLVGYSTAVVSGIILTEDNASITLDTITLKSGETFTEEIEIEAEVPPVTFAPDKKIFNVDKNMNVKGGSVSDVLRNLPGVTVDVDGNVSLRGSENVKILVDGRPMGLDGPARTQILQQIPADNVKDIELITNPSAKYEAEGTSGIINIVLKKNDNNTFGYNGNIQLNAGTRDKYNGGLNLNLRNDKINIFGNYSYRLFNFQMEGSGDRTSIFNNVTTDLDQFNDGRFRVLGHFIKGGFDYYTSKTGTLSFASNYSNRERRHRESNENLLYQNSSLSNHFITKFDNFNTGFDFDGALTYNLKFKNPKNQITAEVNYAITDDSDTRNVSQSNIIPFSSNPELSLELEKTKIQNMNALLDYEHPFSEDFKLEAGYKGTIRKNDNDYSSEYFDYSSNQYINDTNRTNLFRFNEMIQAAYSTYSGKYVSFSFQLGARVEHTKTDGELVAGTSFERNYTDIFPSLSLTQKLGEKEELQGTYSRRIQRPHMRFLNPFVNKTDPLNYFSGNSNLQPEYINQFELSFIKYFDNITFTPSLFYRESDNQISRTRVLIDSNVSLTTFTNYAKAKTYGGEMIANVNLFQMWNTNINFSYYKQEVSDPAYNNNTANETYTWSGNINSNLRLPEIVNLQLSYFYSGKMTTPTAIVEPFHSFDISANRDFFGGKLNLGARVADVFNTLKFNVIIDAEDYKEDFYRQRDNRALFLTLTYKFGKQENKGPQRRRRNTENNEPSDGFGF